MEFITSVMKPHIIYIGNKVSNSKINPTTHSTLVENLRAEGFTVYSASSQKLKLLRLLDMLLLFLRKKSKVTYVLIDVYSTQNFWYAVLLARFAKLYSVNYIPILHGGDLISRFNRSEKVTKSLLNNAHAIVSPSEYLKKEVENMRYNQVLHIPNPLDLNKYPFKQRKNIQPKLLWVRAFSKIYNPMMAIKAFEIIIEKFPYAELCMVGPDKDGTLEKCKGYVLSKKLNISFTGKLKKKEWISLATNFDIFINTTRIDNIPVSVLEAISLGLPIISTKVGGIPYLIDDGINGMLVASNDAQAMSQTIEFLIENPRKAEQMADSARQNLVKYNWNILKQDWFKLLH